MHLCIQSHIQAHELVQLWHVFERVQCVALQKQRFDPSVAAKRLIADAAVPTKVTIQFVIQLRGCVSVTFFAKLLQSSSIKFDRHVVERISCTRQYAASFLIMCKYRSIKSYNSMVSTTSPRLWLRIACCAQGCHWAALLNSVRPIPLDSPLNSWHTRNTKNKSFGNVLMAVCFSGLLGDHTSSLCRWGCVSSRSTKSNRGHTSSLPNILASSVKHIIRHLGA